MMGNCKVVMATLLSHNACRMQISLEQAGTIANPASGPKMQAFRDGPLFMVTCSSAHMMNLSFHHGTSELFR